MNLSHALLFRMRFFIFFFFCFFFFFSFLASCWDIIVITINSCHIFYSRRVVDIPDGKPKWDELEEKSDLIEDSPSELKMALMKKQQKRKREEEEDEGEDEGGEKKREWEEREE